MEEWKMEEWKQAIKRKIETVAVVLLTFHISRLTFHVSRLTFHIAQKKEPCNNNVTRL